MKSKKVSIRGTTWKFRIISDDLFDKRHGENHEVDPNNLSAAITSRHEKLVDFRPDEVTIINIRHELMHCYVFTCLIEDSDLNKDQMEEICCNIIGEHGEELSKIANKIYRGLDKLTTK